MVKKFHPFHMLEMSPWPILSSLASMAMTSSLIILMHKTNSILFLISQTITILAAYLWWKNVSQESLHQGEHIKQSMNNLKIGMILFISSEVLFFSSFFWAYFHSSISPNMEIGTSWPPSSINPFDPMNIPLLNTLILLSSGVSITWAHHSIIKNNYSKFFLATISTLILGIYFTTLQMFEYIQAEFSMSDSSYGSTFFMATGFHGIHVIIGSSFIMISWLRMKNLMNSSIHTIGFETAAWYWHFVDVVWLFLYSSIYWWGS